jgi:RNA polymerase sigma-70 factor (ECF subfamily)
MADQAARVYQTLLVIRCQAGDHAAFAELVGLYRSRLRYFLQKIVGEAPDAEDLLQDVWLEVFKGISKLSDPGAFRTWLYQVARHRAFHALKKRRQLPRQLEGVDPPSKEEGEVNFSAEEAEKVHAALGRLKPHQSEPLLLRFIEGMSYEEIAQVIGCPLGTVRSRIYYAKQTLRRILERMGEDERERIDSSTAHRH